MNKVRLLCVSDLHCHHGKSSATIDSHLTTEKPRSPSLDHPVEALTDILADKLRGNVDYLLSPGDITNKTDPQGFISGWGFLEEISKLSRARQIIATIGNHDTDSKKIHSRDDMYSLPQSIGKDFPFTNEVSRNQFWTKGYVFKEYANLRVLVINSAKFHIDKANQNRGKITVSQIQEIASYMERQNKRKVSVALCHHHPVSYNFPDARPTDQFTNGPSLLKALARARFDLFIHGHKHYPNLSYFDSDSDRIPVLSCASFSARNSLMMQGVVNAVHLIEICQSQSGVTKGTIRTWEYLEQIGWRAASAGVPNLPHLTGFGSCISIEELSSEVASLALGKGLQVWADYLREIPDLAYLTPSGQVKLDNILEDKYKLRVLYDRQISPDSIRKIYQP